MGLLLLAGLIAGIFALKKRIAVIEQLSLPGADR